MNAAPPPPLRFADALRHGRTFGYAIAATPVRFARLPTDTATAFAELIDNCCHIFETRGEARRHLRLIPPDNRLGWIHRVRKVAFFPDGAAPHGPRLDIRGHPFDQRILVADRSGRLEAWQHGGRFGWLRPPAPATPAPDPVRERGTDAKKSIAARVRGLFS